MGGASQVPNDVNPKMFFKFLPGVVKWDFFFGDQTMQIYGNIEGIPLFVHCGKSWWRSPLPKGGNSTGPWELRVVSP